MEREQRDPRLPIPEQTKEWVDGEQRVSHHHRSTIHFPPVTPCLLLPLFLPLSRVISSFTFLVSASSSHPPSRAPLTAFSNAFQLSSTSISIRYLFYQFTSRCTRVARPGNSCSVARLTTPRRNFEKERERERRRNRVRSLSFSFRGLLFEENRDRGKFSTGLVASSARNFFSAQNYALGPCIMYIFVRWGEGARSGPGRKYSKGA